MNLFHTDDTLRASIADDPELDVQTKELFLVLVDRPEGSVAIKTIEQFCQLMHRGYLRVHGFPPAPCVLLQMAERIGNRKKIRVNEFFQIMVDVMGNFPEPSL